MSQEELEMFVNSIIEPVYDSAQGCTKDACPLNLVENQDDNQ